MAKERRTGNKRAAEFTRSEIFESCSKYGSQLETSLRALAEEYFTSEAIITKLHDRGVIEGIATLELVSGMRKTAMYNARRGAANWAESEVRKAFRKKFDKLSEEGFGYGDPEWEQMQAERDEQIAIRRATDGRNAEQSSWKRYEELLAMRAAFHFSMAEERDIFVTLVESRWPKSIYCTREYIAPDVLERVIERVIGNPDCVDDKRVAQYEELYITGKASNEEKAAFERGVTRRRIQKLESISGKVEVFRQFIAAGANRTKFLADNPWLTSKKFAECLRDSITIPNAATDEEVALCIKLVTAQNNSPEVEAFFQDLITKRTGEKTELFKKPEQISFFQE